MINRTQSEAALPGNGENLYMSVLTARRSRKSELPLAKRAVIRVGDGRGFVVEDDHEIRYIITASHCLPHLPPCHAASYTEDRTYQSLLGLLGERTEVWSECLFVNPVADIAVLGCPDNQELPEHADAYENLVSSLIPLRIGSVRGTQKGYVLSLQGQWVSEKVIRPAHSGKIQIGPVFAGQSGSPILNQFHEAVGVLVLGVENSSEDTFRQAYLPNDLPAWLAAALRRGKSSRNTTSVIR